MDIIRLETPRLILRAHRLDDLTRAQAMWADPWVSEFLGRKPCSLTQCWLRMTSYLGHWSLMGFGYWAIEEKSSGLFIGECGLADFKREIEPSIAGIPELGGVVTRSVQGQGYGTEALLAALTWGDANLDSPQTVCLVDPENLASLRITEKCGYREYARTMLYGDPQIMFTRDRRT